MNATTSASITGSAIAVTTDIIQGNISLGVASIDAVNQVLLHAILYPAGGALAAVAGKMIFEIWQERRTKRKGGKL